jgi:hypothetical protein
VLPNVNTDYRYMGFKRKFQSATTRDNRKEEKEKRGRGKGRTEQGILIWCCDDLELLRTYVIPQPSPPTTLNTSRDSIKLFLERIHRTKVPLQCGFQLAVVFEVAAALVRRCEVLPEQSVIYVALAVGVRSG